MMKHRKGQITWYWRYRYNFILNYHYYNTHDPAEEQTFYSGEVVWTGTRSIVVRTLQSLPWYSLNTNPKNRPVKRPIAKKEYETGIYT